MTREEAIAYLVPINEVFKEQGFNRAFTLAIETLCSSPWRKVSDGGLPKDRAFLAYCASWGKGTVDRIRWNARNGGFDNLSEIPPSASIKESHFEDFYDYWMEIPELPKDGDTR